MLVLYMYDLILPYPKNICNSSIFSYLINYVLKAFSYRDKLDWYISSFIFYFLFTNNSIRFLSKLYKNKNKSFILYTKNMHICDTNGKPAILYL